MQVWLHLLLIIGLAVAAWISSMDMTGSSTTTAWLWGAAAIGATHLLFRFLKAAR